MGRPRNFGRSLKKLTPFDRFKSVFDLRANRQKKNKRVKNCIDGAINGHITGERGIKIKCRSPWKVEELTTSKKGDVTKEPLTIEDDDDDDVRVVNVLNSVRFNGDDKTGEQDEDEEEEEDVGEVVNGHVSDKMRKVDVSHFEAPRENSFYDDWLREFECSDGSDGENEDLDMSFGDYESYGADESDVHVVGVTNLFQTDEEDNEMGEEGGLEEEGGNDDDDNEDDEEDDGNKDEEENNDSNLINEAEKGTEPPEALSYEYFALNDKVFVLLMCHPMSFAIRGVICLKVILGRINIGGYVRDTTKTDYVTVRSIDKFGVQFIRTLLDEGNNSSGFEYMRNILLENGATEDIVATLSKSNHSVVLCRKDESRSLSYLDYAYGKKLFPCRLSHPAALRFRSSSYGCRFFLRPFGEIAKDWKNIVSSILEYMKSGSERSPRILVCGSKNVGKSTLCRYVANCLLNESDTISWLECDPAQTEFTPPGMLSLVDVDEPILGAPFTHHKEPEMMLFSGGISVGDSPSHYMNCIKKLVDYHNERKSENPLIVNTMGWVLEVGLALMVDICNLVKPTHIINILGFSTHLVRCKNISKESLTTGTGWQFGTMERTHPAEYYETKSANVGVKSVVSAKVARDLSLVSYLGQLQNKEGPFHPINECPCYRVSWSSVALHVCHKTVPLSEILYIFNGSLVALCQIDPKEIVSTSDPTLPKFLEQTPIIPCYGYGIVRAIGMKEKCFYVMTSVSTDVLNGINVMLYGGGLNIPVSILLSQSVDGNIPYLSSIGKNGKNGIMDKHVQQPYVTIPSHQRWAKYI